MGSLDTLPTEKSLKCILIVNLQRRASLPGCSYIRGSTNAFTSGISGAGVIFSLNLQMFNNFNGETAEKQGLQVNRWVNTCF